MDDDADPRAAFAERLRALKDAAGISVRDLVVASARTPRRRVGQPPLRLKRSTIDGMVSRTRPVRPEQEHVEVFVDTCIRVAAESDQPLPANLGNRQVWDAAYRELLVRIAGVRGANRSATEAAQRLRRIEPDEDARDSAGGAGDQPAEPDPVGPLRRLSAVAGQVQVQPPSGGTNNRLRPSWSGLPGLPSRFTPRPALVAQARRLLVESAGVPVGLLGTGGAGKSTLAKALCADEIVRSSCPDGIVWLDVGPEPDLAVCITRVLAAFGDTAALVNVPAGLDRLRACLDGASCLLVLDNVWDAEPVRRFAGIGRGLRLLVTTRNLDVLFHDSAFCAVGPVDEPTALRLLAAHAGCTPEQVPVAEGREILARSGGLVLALAIAGGMVAEGRRWSSVAARLRRSDLDKIRLSGRFQDYPDDNLLSVLDANVGMVTAEQRSRYRELAVFEGHGPVPLPVVMHLWAATAGMDELDAEDLVLLLARRCLVAFDDEDRSLTLHDLLFDYLRRTAGENSLTKLHGAFADSLLARWGDLDRGLPWLRMLACPPAGESSRRPAEALLHRPMPWSTSVAEA